MLASNMGDATIPGEYSWYLRVNEAGLPVISVRDNISKAPPLATQGLVTSLYTAAKHAGITIKAIEAHPIRRTRAELEAMSLLAPPTNTIDDETAAVDQTANSSTPPIPILSFVKEKEGPLSVLFTNNCTMRRAGDTFDALQRVAGMVSSSIIASIGAANHHALLANPNQKAIRAMLSQDAVAMQRCLRCVSRSLALPLRDSSGTVSHRLQLHLPKTHHETLSNLLFNAAATTHAHYACMAFGNSVVTCTPSWSTLPASLAASLLIRSATAVSSKMPASDAPIPTWDVRQFVVFLPAMEDTTVWSIPATAVVIPVAVTRNDGAHSTSSELLLNIGSVDAGIRFIFLRPAQKKHRASTVGAARALMEGGSRRATVVAKAPVHFTPRGILEAFTSIIAESVRAENGPTAAQIAAAVAFVQHFGSTMQSRGLLVDWLLAARNPAASVPCPLQDMHPEEYMALLRSCLPGIPLQCVVNEATVPVLEALQRDIGTQAVQEMMAVCYGVQAGPKQVTWYWLIRNSEEASASADTSTSIPLLDAWASNVPHLFSATDATISVHSLKPAGSISTLAEFPLSSFDAASAVVVPIVGIRVLLEPSRSARVPFTTNADLADLPTFCHQMYEAVQRHLSG